MKPPPSARPPRGADDGSPKTMTRRSPVQSDAELMEHADGERDEAELADRLARDPGARAKVAAVQELGELVRGHLELAADDVHDAKFAAMWRRIEGQLDGEPRGAWARVMAWFDRY